MKIVKVGRPRNDISGNRYGKLLVLSYCGSDNSRASWYECLCECGNKKIVSQSQLTRKDEKRTQSCGCSKWETLVSRYSHHITLSENLRRLLDGLLISDGGLTPTKHGKTARFELKTPYFEYADSVANTLAESGVSDMAVSQQNTKYKGQRYVSWRVSSLHFVELGDEWSRWYSNGIKIVPKDIEMDKTTLLWWYLGDGSLSRSANAISLATNCFTIDEVDYLVGRIENDLDIDAHRYLHKNKTGLKTPIIKIHGENVLKFLNLIGEPSNGIYSYKFHPRIVYRNCIVCGDRYYARAGKITCSDSCRAKNQRQMVKQNEGRLL